MPRSKYGNVKTTVDGIKFDSKSEARRYVELKLMLDAGQIRNLRLQPEFHIQESYYDPIAKAKVPAITYRADFSYEKECTVAPYLNQWVRVVEDVKGVETEAFKLKYKLMIERLGIWVDIIK